MKNKSSNHFKKTDIARFHKELADQIALLESFMQPANEALIKNALNLIHADFETLKKNEALLNKLADTTPNYQLHIDTLAKDYANTLASVETIIKHFAEDMLVPFKDTLASINKSLQSIEIYIESNY